MPPSLLCNGYNLRSLTSNTNKRPPVHEHLYGNLTGRQVRFISLLKKTRLQAEFGKGFDVGNLRSMRQFYLLFPKRDALRSVLSWTHYHALIRVENPLARQWYTDEATQQNWSTRTLERQISKLYYERLLASQDKALVEQEAQEKMLPCKTIHETSCAIPSSSMILPVAP